MKARRVQVDEIWAFTYAKAKNVGAAKAAPEQAGDTWTWTAIDADSKLLVSWLVGGRDSEYAGAFMADVKERLANRVQLTSDGHKAYLGAVENAFGADVDYAMLVKLFGAAPDAAKGRYSPAECTGIRKTRIEGDPDPKHVSTSYAERQNLTMRMQMRRFTRLTNAFSKKWENHVHMVALYTVWYNFVKQHWSLKGLSPAMASGVSQTLWSMTDLAAMVDGGTALGGALRPRRRRGLGSLQSRSPHLLGLLQPQQELVLVQALGAPAEAVALHRADDLAQPLVLGVALRHERLQRLGVVGEGRSRRGHDQIRSDLPATYHRSDALRPRFLLSSPRPAP